jgi:uncharacterized membrane protein YvbJ
MNIFSCKACGFNLNHEFKFCPRCGRIVMIMRSQNEIQAEIQKLKAIKTETIPPLAIAAVCVGTLEWALGRPDSPSSWSVFSENVTKDAPR